MAKKNVTIGITFAYDPDEHGGMEAHVFLHRFLWETNLRTPIVGLEYKGSKREYDADNPMGDLPLRMADTIDPDDLGIPAPAPEPKETVKADIPEDEIPTVLDFSKPPITVTHEQHDDIGR